MIDQANEKVKYCLNWTLDCRREAESSRLNRMALNRDNYRMYQLDYDFSHKQKGQSKEVLSKVRNAVEQIKSYFQQALADLGDWFAVETSDGSEGDAMLVKPEEMQKLMTYFLGRADYFSHVGKSMQSGLLGSVAVSKVRGELIPKPKFVARKKGKGKSYQNNVVLIEDKTWELRFDDIRQEDYYPDPTGTKLYEIINYELDLHVVKAMAAGEDAIFDKATVDLLKPWGGDDTQQGKKAEETGQNQPPRAMRPKVKITEYIGTIVDQTTGDIVCENCICTIANDTTVIREPTPNTLWHQRSDIVAAALIEVSHSVWGVALMDAGTKHNKSLIEVFNLMLDSAMKAVWGINQIRVDAMEDPTQLTDGIRWGTNIKITAALPVGGKVMEPVVTGDIPNDVFNLYNMLTQETTTSMMTSDLRMGAQSARAVKATEVVASENSITSVFQGMAKNIEEKKIQPELELACWTICQNWDLIDIEIFKSLFGPQRGTQLSQLEPQDVFVATVNGLKFRVYGISIALRKQADFRKWTTLLQVISGSEVLVEAFLQKYSFQNFLGEVMTALDINKSKIENPATAAAGATVPNAKAAANGGAQAQPGGAPSAQPNMQSQQPQAASAQMPGGPLSQVFSNGGPQPMAAPGGGGPR